MFDEDLYSQRRARSRLLRARCPECESWVMLKDSVEQWDVVTCPACKAELEVVQLRPPMLDYINGTWDDDDWEDDWEEDD